MIETLSQTDDGVKNFWKKSKREKVVNAIVSLGPISEKELIKFLKSKNNIARNTAALALFKINPTLLKSKILPRLQRDLKNRSIVIRRETVLTLGDIGPESVKILPTVLKIIKNSRKASLSKKIKNKTEANEFLRAECDEAIGKIGKPTEENISILIDELRPIPEFLKSDVYLYAGTPLISWGKRSVPRLVRAIRDPNLVFQSRIANILGQIGPEARESLLALQHLIFFDKTMIDPANKEIRQQLVKALLMISPESKNKVFADFVLTTNADVAAHDLGSTELKSYIEALQDENKLVRKKTAMILGKISPSPKEALPGLTWSLFDPEAEVAIEAAIAIRKFGSIANESAPYLINCFSSNNSELRMEAVKTLSAIGPLNNDVIIGLFEATKDKDKKIRAALKDLLTRIGLDEPTELNKAIEMMREKG